MITGINANIQHEGLTYHVQTEDGGIENPVITTLLFKEGAICSSKKTNYQERLQSDSLEGTVKRLMEAQHREMLQELSAGKFKPADAGHPAPSSPPPSPARRPAQEQVESRLPMEKDSLHQAKQPVERKRKGLDVLIQDYLANKQTGQD